MYTANTQPCQAVSHHRLWWEEGQGIFQVTQDQWPANSHGSRNEWLGRNHKEWAFQEAGQEIASLAAVSAYSFKEIPMWLGTQQNSTCLNLPEIKNSQHWISTTTECIVLNYSKVMRALQECTMTKECCQRKINRQRAYNTAYSPAKKMMLSRCRQLI